LSRAERLRHFKVDSVDELLANLKSGRLYNGCSTPCKVTDGRIGVDATLEGRFCGQDVGDVTVFATGGLPQLR